MSLHGATWSIWLLFAACQSGGYVALRGGYSGARDVDHAPGVSSDSYPGPSLALAAGATVADGVRAELECSHRQHAFGDFELAGGVFGGAGRLFASGALVNVLYDVELDRWWHPFIGCGVGAMRVGYDIDAFGGRFVDDADIVFASQAMIGIRTSLSRHWSLSLAYRLMVTGDPILQDELQRRFAGEYVSQTVEFGVTWRW